MQACVERGIHTQLPGIHSEDGLMMLATVAIEQSEKQTHQKRMRKEATLGWPLQKPPKVIHTASQSKTMCSLKGSASSLSLKSTKTGDSMPQKSSLCALLEDDDQLKCLKQNLSYRKYVVKKIDIVSRKGGKFASRVGRLGGEIQKCFVQWNNLSDDQNRNLYLNTRYIIHYCCS